MGNRDTLLISPGHPLRGTCTLPGDKSISHRCAILAAMAEGQSVIENFLVAGVTRVMLGALEQLGVKWTLDGSTLVIDSPGLNGWHSPTQPLDCGNSATTMRLLAGALAASGVPAVLDGSPVLRSRPMGRIIIPLQSMGVPITGTASNCAPLTLSAQQPGQQLHSIDYKLPVASAQVKSCLLLAALAAPGTTTLHEPAPSRDHTERLLASLGLSIEHEISNTGSTVRLAPPVPFHLSPFQTHIPGDLSSAAFLVVAALVTPGSQITIKKVGLNPCRTGLLDALVTMGAQVAFRNVVVQGAEPVGDLVIRTSELQPTNVFGQLVVRMIDEFPAFAIAAAFARGDSLVQDAAELRLKESDRIGVLVVELHSLGIHASETGDGFVVHGGSIPPGGLASSHGDHRLAMALAVAGLASRQPVEVSGAGCIDESFPAFIETLAGLGANIREGP